MHEARVANGSTRRIQRRFRLGRLLGKGGSGEVYEAEDLLHHRQVALKLLRAEHADGGQEEALRSEFRVLRSFSHPGIVQVFDFGYTQERSPFYTMELLVGGDLHSSGIDVDAYQLLRDVAEALDFLHVNGIVHSDLKPSNIFVSGDPPRFKLTDFGLARRTRGGRSNALYGTLAYMPPERLGGMVSPPDPREDLYALGAILYEALVGRPPFIEATPEQTIASILAGNLDQALAHVPEKWLRVLQKLLHSDPAERYANAWDLLQQVAAHFDRPPPQAPVWDPPFVGRRRELAKIRDAIADLGRNRGILIEVSGLPGMGKSALLEAAAQQIATLGLPCLRFDTPAAPSALVLVERLSTLYGRWSSGLSGDAAEAAQRLRRWPGELRAARNEEEQLNANAHALGNIRRIATACPHVVIVDDAHRLDSGSLAFLSLMSLSVRQMGVALLIGSRTATVAMNGLRGSDASLEDTLRTARTTGVVRSIVMREFADDDVRTLVQRRFGAHHDFDTLAERVHELTQGHPFFVIEALQNLVLTEQLRRDRNGWHLAANTQRKMLPRMADTILSEHIAAARREDRGVFEVLALLPSGADVATLSEVLDGESERIDAALSNGLDVGLLQRHGRPARFTFRHELIREACAARCPDGTARRTHQRIADALAGTPAEAYHRLAAAEKTERSRACFLRAAEGYDKRRAPWEALRYFEAALKIDPQAADADDVALRVARLGVQVGHARDAARLLLQRLVTVRKPLIRARYLQLLGDAYSREGRNDEALFHLQAAAELFRRYAEADEQNRFAADLGRVLIAKGDLVGAIDTCRRALDEHEASPTSMSRAPLFLLKAQAERQSGDYTSAEHTCRGSLELLKPQGRTHELAQTYTQIGTNYHYRGEFGQAERFYRAALKVHTELGDLQGMKSTHNDLGLAQMRAGRLEEAVRSYETSLDLKRQLGDRVGEANSLNNLGNIWERRGEYERALQCYRRAIQIFRRLDRPRELAILFNNTGQVHLVLGRFHSALRHAERACRYALQIDSPHVTLIVEFNRGRTLLRLWDTDEAAKVLKAGLRRVRGAGMHDLAAQFHACLALAYARAADARLAGEHMAETADSLPRLEKEARLRVRLLLAETHECLGHVDAALECATEAEALAAGLERTHDRVRTWRLMAAAGVTKGDWDVAETGLQKAIAAARDMGFRYELAKCYKLLGALHWDIGLRSRARAEFERCFELLQALGLRTELGLSYLDVARLSREGEIRS